MTIPNEEVRSQFKTKHELYYTSTYPIDLEQVQKCASFIDQLSTSDNETKL